MSQIKWLSAKTWLILGAIVVGISLFRWNYEFIDMTFSTVNFDTPRSRYPITLVPVLRSDRNCPQSDMAAFVSLAENRYRTVAEIASLKYHKKKAELLCVMVEEKASPDDQRLFNGLTMGPYADPMYPNAFVYTQEVAVDQGGGGKGNSATVSCGYLVPNNASLCQVPEHSSPLKHHKSVNDNPYDIFRVGIGLSADAAAADATDDDDVAVSEAEPREARPFIVNGALQTVFGAPGRSSRGTEGLSALLGPDSPRGSGPLASCPPYKTFVERLCATQVQILHERTAEREREYAEVFRERHGRNKEFPVVRGEEIDLDTHMTMKDMLIVITTCNHLDITMKSIKSIENAFSDYADAERPDILVVDDRSTDGTPYLLKRMGYAVVQSWVPKGVTFSWNVGYRVAKLLGNYNHVVFMNNDIIVPRGTFELLYYDLRFFPLVVPTTAFKGSGIPQQSFEAVHELASMNMFYEEFLMNPFNTLAVQRMLLQERTKELRARQKSLFKSHTTTAIPSFRWFIYPRFNGFLFCINISAVSARQIPFDEYTFFNPSNLMIHQEDHVTDLFYERHITPVIEKYAFAYHYKSVTVAAAGRNQKVDKRENLSFYHKEGGEELVEPLEPIQRVHTSASGDVRTFAQKLPHYHSVDEMFRVPAAVHAKLLTQGEFELHPFPSTRVVVVGLVSDSTPVGADSDFNLNGVAHALGVALLESSENVRVKYLQPHLNWYQLSFVDVLLVLTPNYQLRKTRGTKPLLFTIAWVVQDVAQWMALPSLGNYMKVIAATDAQAAYIETALRGPGADGLPIQCFSFCHGLLSSLVLSRVTEEAFMGGGAAGRVPLVPVLRLAARSGSAPVAPGIAGGQGVMLYLAKPASYCTGASERAYNEILDEMGRAGPKPATELRCGGGNIDGSPGGVAWSKEFEKLAVIVEDVGVTDVEAAVSNPTWGADSVSGTQIIFDAIRANVLVVTNNKAANDELFGGLLPTFDKLGESVTIVSRLLANPTARQDLLAKLQAVVQSKHTYTQRAGVFKALLREFPLVLPIIDTPAPKPAALTNPPAAPTLCVALRTQYQDLVKLHQTLDGLLTQHTSSVHREKVGLKVYIFDPNPNKVLPEQSRESRTVINNLHAIADTHNNRSGSNHVTVVGEQFIYYNHYETSLYYHSRSDMLLRYMLSDHPVAAGDPASEPDSVSCKWLFLPDDEVKSDIYSAQPGDSVNSSSWFDVVAESLLRIEENARLIKSGSRAHALDVAMLLWAKQKHGFSTTTIVAGAPQVQSESKMTRLGGLNHIIARRDLFMTPEFVEFLPQSLLSKLSHGSQPTSEKEAFNRNLAPGQKGHGAGVVESNFIKALLSNHHHLLDALQ